MPITTTYVPSWENFCRPKSSFPICSHVIINLALTINLCAVCPYFPADVHLVSGARRYLILSLFRSPYFLCFTASRHTYNNPHFISCFIWLTARSRVLLNNKTLIQLITKYSSPQNPSYLYRVHYSTLLVATLSQIKHVEVLTS